MNKTLSLTLVLTLGLAMEVAKADFTFGEPTNLGSPVNSSSNDSSPSVSFDGLTLFFQSNRPGGYGSTDLWVATRNSTDQPWDAADNLGPTVNSTALDNTPIVSADGLTLYFASERAGGLGDRDLWMTTRQTLNNSWDLPVNLGPTVNSPDRDAGPCISADGLALYFGSRRAGGSGSMDLWLATLTTKDSDWGTPVNLGPAVNSSSSDVAPRISVDGLMLGFASSRPDGSGSMDIYVSSRETSSNPWSTPLNVEAINTSTWDSSPFVSHNGSTPIFAEL